jgi:phosphoribosylanthranilate isomerase
MIVKVCGMRNADNIRDVVNAGADWIGMIFWKKSPRFADMPADSAKGLNIKMVGVFVDETVEQIIERVKEYSLDIVQLHGKESPTMIDALKEKLGVNGLNIFIIKAISISNHHDITDCLKYENHIDGFLFDTKCKCVGGSGEHFDWNILDAYHGDRPFLLSGGIGPDDDERILNFHHPLCIGIDINSRFEIEPGLKDANKVKEFISKIQKHHE